MSRLLTPDEAAAVLAIKRWRVIAMARGGGLPHVRFGRDYRFPEAELDAWIADRTAYTAVNGEATPPRERRGDGLSRARPPKAVGGKHRRGVDAGGPSDQAGPLRIVRA